MFTGFELIVMMYLGITMGVFVSLIMNIMTIEDYMHDPDTWQDLWDDTDWTKRN